MIKVLAISDLHGFLPEIPACDLLLLGGDYAPTRNIEQQKRYFEGPFADWLNSLKAHYIVGVAGNWDFALQTYFDLPKSLPWIYLQDEVVELETVKIFGSPWTIPFGDMAFMKSDYELREIYKGIPDKLDIVLTHGPAYRHLDKTAMGNHVGSMSLWERINEVQPDSHVFGHIHESRGILQHENTRFYNVSHVNVALEPKFDPVNIVLRA